MRVLIIEDEPRAAKRLEKLITEVDSSITVIGSTESIRESVSFLESNKSIDLIFSDIQLADGLSFKIFDQIEPACPIIFTTAYDQYALNAFKTNGIDYLLKPVTNEDLTKAISKFRKMSMNVSAQELFAITQSFTDRGKSYKTRFMVKVGEHIHSIPVDGISHFSSEHKATFLYSAESKKFIIDYSLEQLIDMLDPKLFFRVSRKYIVAIDFIVDVISYSNSRLKIKPSTTQKEDIIVSREKVTDFKKWLDG